MAPRCARFEDGYRVDLEAFRDRLSPRTRLVMLASPGNPSGVPIMPGEIDEILAAMARRCPEALLLVDETFREATYGGATVGRWIGAQDGRLQWLRPEAGAFCCVRLDPGMFGLPDVRRFHDRLAERRTAVAPGPWFGDSAHVMRLGLAYPAEDELEKGLGVIAAALRP